MQSNTEIIDVTNPETQRSMRTYSMIVYGLYALGLFMGFLPTLVGLIMAYVKRNEFAGTVYKEHMSLLIRTFWYSLLFAAIGALLLFVYVGALILFASGVWYVYRLVRGFIRMNDGKGMW